MILPKLHRWVDISFMSLRNGFGEGYGVIFDIDTRVSRKMMRAVDHRYECGWSWVVSNADGQWWNTEADMTCLNDVNGPEDVSDMYYTNPVVAMRIYGITEEDLADTGA